MSNPDFAKRLKPGDEEWRGFIVHAHRLVVLTSRTKGKAQLKAWALNIYKERETK